MIVVANRGTRVENLGLVDYRPCSTCSSVQPFYLIRQYRYYAVYWLLSFVTSEHYWHVCSGCNQGPYLGNKLLDPQKTAGGSVPSPAGSVKPIPLWRRYGLFYPIAVGAAVSVLAALMMLVLPHEKRQKIPGIVLENSHSLLVHPPAETPAYVVEPAPAVVLSSSEIAKSTLLHEVEPMAVHLFVDGSPWYTAEWPVNTSVAELSSYTLKQHDGSRPFRGFHDGDVFVVVVAGAEYNILTSRESAPVKSLWTGVLRVERKQQARPRTTPRPRAR